MTKETKIGLVVGLAFIILFAIILSEKGANTGSKVPSHLTVVDSGESPTTGAEKPFHNAGRVAVEESLPDPMENDTTTPTSIVMLEEPVGQPIPGEDEPIDPLPDAVVNGLNIPLIESEIPVNAPSTPETDSMSLREALTVALNAPPSDEGALVIDDEFPITPEMSRASLLDRTAAEQKPKSSMKIIAVHKVRSGESLGKIAAKHYGRSTPSRIAAIFDANRDRLSSIHSVRAGSKLNIPKLDAEQDIAFEPVTHFAPAEIVSHTRPTRDSSVRIPIPVDDRLTRSIPSNAAPFASAPDTTRASRAPVNFKWYKVRDRDTLSRIAKRELGNEKLFLDIYKLNKDIITNKHKIKPGMKIRLPIQVSSAPPMATVLSALGEPSEP
ncbi:MAG: LysM peptidoglycan-binding domain-containing protein [Phycisphaerales bacterium]|nr:LysM peptidoglycan-binding domain-containing protein [Phycisphaerales bacterium]